MPPPTPNRPRRIRLFAAVVIILGRYQKAVDESDLDMCEIGQKVLALAALTEQEVYLTEETNWTSEQADVHAAVVAFCESLELGEWPAVSALSDAVGTWEGAVKGL